MSSKRFLIYTQYFAPEIGASQSRLTALVRQLKKFGHSVEVVTAVPHHLRGQIFASYRGRFYVKENWEEVPVHRTWVYASSNSAVKGRLLNYGSFVATSLAGLLKSGSADYLFVESPPLFLSIPAVFYGALKRTPVILNVADLWPESVKLLGVMRDGPALRAAEHLERWAYRHAHYVNAVTDGIFKALTGSRGLSPSKVLFLPNGVDTDEFRSQEPDPDLLEQYGLRGKNVFIYAGTHGLAYRLEMLVEAAARLKDLGVVFMLVGDGYTKQPLMDLAARSQVENIVFVESQPESEMPRYFSIACGSVIPLAKNRLFEGTRPAKLFPSLAAGVPVVYCGEGEGARLVAQAQAGLIVPAEDTEAFINAVRTLVESATLHQEMVMNARRYAIEHFDWKLIVGRWLDDLMEREAGSTGMQGTDASDHPSSRRTFRSSETT